MEKIPSSKNKHPAVGRIRERLQDKDLEKIKSQARIMQKISADMEDVGMTEPHMAYALLQKGYGHKFVQEYLSSGNYAFFDKNGDAISDLESILEIIKNFDLDNDADKTLVPEE